MRYARQELLPDFKGSSGLLASKKAAVVGVGGLGGLCTYLLAGAGVIKLNIADGDCVSLSNLHRQVLYRMHDIGHKKTEICKKAILELDDRAEVGVFPEINSGNFEEFAAGSDLVLDLSDNSATRMFISKACFARRINYIHAAVGGYRGILSAFWYADPEFIEKFGCYRCFAGLLPDLKPAGILGPAASMMASAAAMLALQVLNGNTDLKGYVQLFDLKNNTVKKLGLTKDRSCPVCGG